jgi:hypothetical protein
MKKEKRKMKGDVVRGSTHLSLIELQDSKDTLRNHALKHQVLFFGLISGEGGI